MEVWSDISKMMKGTHSGCDVLSNAMKLGEAPPDLFFKAAQLKHKLTGTENEMGMNDLFESICYHLTAIQQKKLRPVSAAFLLPRSRNEEKEAIIAAALDTDEGRKVLAEAMIQPIR